MRVLRQVGLAAAALGFLLLGAASAEAQVVASRHAREGFWFSAGIGAGALDVDCDACGGDAEWSGTGWMRFGAALNQRVTLGLDLSGWLDHHDYGDDTFGAVSGILLLYPFEDAGLFLSGGAGLGQLRFEDGWDELETTGFAWSAGVGYDLRVGESFSLTPYVSAIGMLEGDAEIDGFEIGERFRATLFQFGLGITFH